MSGSNPTAAWTAGVFVHVPAEVELDAPIGIQVHVATPGAHLPRVLVVAPLSGHYATLLRDTVRTLLAEHDVWITDWVDARLVPITEGDFNLDDYIDYIISMLHSLGGNCHLVAVCQPSVPVLAAIARMEAEREEREQTDHEQRSPLEPAQEPPPPQDEARPARGRRGQLGPDGLVEGFAHGFALLRSARRRERSINQAATIEIS